MLSIPPSLLNHCIKNHFIFESGYLFCLNCSHPILPGISHLSFSSISERWETFFLSNSFFFLAVIFFLYSQISNGQIPNSMSCRYFFSSNSTCYRFHTTFISFHSNFCAITYRFFLIHILITNIIIMSKQNDLSEIHLKGVNPFILLLKNTSLLAKVFISISWEV